MWAGGDRIRVLICSANLGNQIMDVANLGEWIPADGGSADIVAIGLQESTYTVPNDVYKQTMSEVNKDDVALEAEFSDELADDVAPVASKAASPGMILARSMGMETTESDDEEEEEEGVLSAEEKRDAQIRSVARDFAPELREGDEMRKYAGTLPFDTEIQLKVKHNTYLNALRAYDEAISKDASNSLAHYGSGMVKKKLGQYEEALQRFEKALELDPDARGGENWTRGAAWSAKGKALMALQQPQEAIECFEKATELNPDYDKFSDQLDDAQEALLLAAGDEAAVEDLTDRKSTFNRLFSDFKRRSKALHLHGDHASKAILRTSKSRLASLRPYDITSCAPMISARVVLLPPLAAKLHAMICCLASGKSGPSVLLSFKLAGLGPPGFPDGSTCALIFPCPALSACGCRAC